MFNLALLYHFEWIQVMISSYQLWKIKQADILEKLHHANQFPPTNGASYCKLQMEKEKEKKMDR